MNTSVVGMREAGQTRGPQVCVQVRGVELVELDHVPLLAAHALDDAHAGEVLGEGAA